MATEVKTIEVDSPADIKTLEQFIQEVIESEMKSFPDDLRPLLSKVLFPETHTDHVAVMGKERTLRPLPIKWAKMISHELHDMRVKATAALTSDSVLNIDEESIEAAKRAIRVMSEFYGWTDILEDLEKEEHITTHDIQTLVVTQLFVQGTNDFLLRGLRLILLVMQLDELTAVKMRAASHRGTTLLTP